MSLKRAVFPVPLSLRERSKRERLKRIKEAARLIFREKGFEAATTREIAALADVGTGTLFVYARDKRKLLELVFRDQLATLTENTFAALPLDLPVLEQLIYIFRPRYAFWGDDPRLSRHAVRETLETRYAREENRQEPLAVPALHEHIAALVTRNQAAGKIDPAIDANLAAHLILDIYYNENREWIGGSDPDVEAGIRRLRDVLALSLRGIGAK